MAHRSQRLRLLDIAEQIDAINAAIGQLDEVAIAADWMSRSAIERGIEIISEASRHLDPALIADHPGVPWRRVADIGNWLRHAYDRVEFSLIYAVVTDNFPALRMAIADMLARQPED